MRKGLRVMIIYAIDYHTFAKAAIIAENCGDSAKFARCAARLLL
jgi:hypothetical protein